MIHHVARFVQRNARLHGRYKLRREDGQGLVEYGLVIGLIAVLVAAAVGGVGTSLLALYQTFPGPFS